jgi:hypothetical protein
MLCRFFGFARSSERHRDEEKMKQLSFKEKMQMIKKIISSAVLVFMSFSSFAFGASSGSPLDTSWEHGGGCRKSSLPGMCCHMETRTGFVHCH